MVLPALLIMGFILVYPQVSSFILSLHQYHLAGSFPFKFIGLSNYAQILTEGRFLNSLRLTVEFTIIVVVFDLLFGFIIALSLFKAQLWSKVVRTLFIIPMVFTPVVAGILWRLILNPSKGILNHILLSAGILSKPLSFLGMVQAAFPSLAAIEIWRSTPFVMIVILAGLAALPQEPFEAALIDGARPLQTIRFITVPLLWPIILLITLIRAMDAFRSFDLIYVMTRGGPADSTKTLTMYAYETGFVLFDVGKSSAIIYIITIILLLMSIGLIRMLLQQDSRSA